MYVVLCLCYLIGGNCVLLLFVFLRFNVMEGTEYYLKFCSQNYCFFFIYANKKEKKAPRGRFFLFIRFI